MAKNLYVSNLSYGVDTQQLQEIFETYGDIQSAKVIMDRETGRSRGFGFVEMTSDADANSAISALNGKEIDGRAMIVNEARPREEGGSNSFGAGRSRSDANRRY
jgi:cold-inducible RNA-binding protein